MLVSIILSNKSQSKSIRKSSVFLKDLSHLPQKYNWRQQHRFKNATALNVSSGSILICKTTPQWMPWEQKAANCTLLTKPSITVPCYSPCKGQRMVLSTFCRLCLAEIQNWFPTQISPFLTWINSAWPFLSRPVGMLPVYKALIVTDGDFRKHKKNPKESSYSKIISKKVCYLNPNELSWPKIGAPYTSRKCIPGISVYCSPVRMVGFFKCENIKLHFWKTIRQNIRKISQTTSWGSPYQNIPICNFFFFITHSINSFFLKSQWM